MKEFNSEVKNEPRPDIIISNYPTIELSYAAIVC